LTRKRKGWERKGSTTKKSPSAQDVHPPQVGICPQCTETNQKKESQQTTDSNLGVLNYLLLGIVLVWLYAYLGCEPHINEYLGYPEDTERVVNAVGLFRAWLNFAMVTIVILFTYWDRWKIFKEAISKHIEEVAFRKRANALFIPFALAVIPFTTALNDLVALLSVREYAYHLLMAFIILLIVIDGLVAAILVRKYYDEPLKNILSNHIWAFFIMIVCWFVMTVILSFPLSI